MVSLLAGFSGLPDTLSPVFLLKILVSIRMMYRDTECLCRGVGEERVPVSDALADVWPWVEKVLWLECVEGKSFRVICSMLFFDVF